MENGLIVMSVADYAKKHGFNQIVPTVRKNENGYPFLTFINKEENKAENVYFSKAAADGVQPGEAISSLKPYQIAVTKNAQQEERIKLISNSERVDLESML
jgi:hypothetical protein